MARHGLPFKALPSHLFHLRKENSPLASRGDVSSAMPTRLPFSCDPGRLSPTCPAGTPCHGKGSVGGLQASQRRQRVDACPVQPRSTVFIGSHDGLHGTQAPGREETTEWPLCLAEGAECPSLQGHLLRDATLRHAPQRATLGNKVKMLSPNRPLPSSPPLFPCALPSPSLLSPASSAFELYDNLDNSKDFHLQLQ